MPRFLLIARCTTHMHIHRYTGQIIQFLFILFHICHSGHADGSLHSPGLYSNTSWPRGGRRGSAPDTGYYTTGHGYYGDNVDYSRDRYQGEILLGVPRIADNSYPNVMYVGPNGYHDTQPLYDDSGYY